MAQVRRDDVIPAPADKGLPQSIATFASGWVGFLGVEKIRNIADRVIGIRLPGRKVDEVRSHFTNAAEFTNRQETIGVQV